MPKSEGDCSVQMVNGKVRFNGLEPITEGRNPDFKIEGHIISPVHVEIAKLKETKGQDYNAGCEINDYFPFGSVSYIHMIHLKALRLVSLANSTKAGHVPNHEGIRDSALDLLNYATYFVEAIDAGILKDYDPKNEN